MFLLGVAIAIPSIERELDPWESTPWSAFSCPSSAEWLQGIWEGAVPQLPLTTLNSVLSVVALGHRLFPDRPVKVRELCCHHTARPRYSHHLAVLPGPHFEAIGGDFCGNHERVCMLVRCDALVPRCWRSSRPISVRVARLLLY